MRESTFTLVYWGFIPSFPTKGQLFFLLLWDVFYVLLYFFGGVGWRWILGFWQGVDHVCIIHWWMYISLLENEQHDWWKPVKFPRLFQLCPPTTNLAKPPSKLDYEYNMMIMMIFDFVSCRIKRLHKLDPPTFLQYMYHVLYLFI